MTSVAVVVGDDDDALTEVEEEGSGHRLMRPPDHPIPNIILDWTASLNENELM